MGSTSSKRKSISTISILSDKETEETSRKKDFTKSYDRRELTRLKHSFRNTIDIFILNQLLMSFNFFTDYENEIIPEESYINELNHKLGKNYEKYCLTPDCLAENINEKVALVQENSLNSLLTQRIYIVHDSIAVSNPLDPKHYSTIEKVIYRLTLKKSREHKGFVFLKVNEEEVNVESKEINDLNMPSLSLSDHEQSKLLIKEEPDDEYEYGRFIHDHTPVSLNHLEKDIYSNSIILPSSCFIHVKDSPSSVESESIDEPTTRYLNSMEFMSHFKDNVFCNCIGDILGFSKNDIDKAQYANGKIFIQNWEILPAISIQWPDEMAFEWRWRVRPEIIDDFFRYKWPTDEMIRHVIELNCVVIPNSYSPKRGENQSKPIEWEVHFPKAEEYLISKMSHAQIKCFLFIVALYRQFIEPITKNYGLLVDHIRTHMFWECEKNYRNWPEHELGSKIVMVLTNLKRCLSERFLPNYFIRNKNMFANVPFKHLRANQDAIHQILSNPTGHFMTVLNNLQYKPNCTFPALNIKLLHRYMTNEGIQLIDPDIYEAVLRARKKLHEPKAGGKLNKGSIYKRKSFKQKIRNNTKKEFSSEFNSDLEIIRQNIDAIAKTYILKLFIEYFPKIAKTFKNRKQKCFYLKQTQYLKKILAEFAPNEEDAKTYREIGKTQGRAGFLGSTTRLIENVEINVGRLNQTLQSRKEFSKSLESPLMKEEIDLNHIEVVDV